MGLNPLAEAQISILALYVMPISVACFYAFYAQSRPFRFILYLFYLFVSSFNGLSLEFR